MQPIAFRAPAFSITSARHSPSERISPLALWLYCKYVSRGEKSSCHKLALDTIYHSEKRYNREGTASAV